MRSGFCGLPPSGKMRPRRWGTHFVSGAVSLSRLDQAVAALPRFLQACPDAGPLGFGSFRVVGPGIGESCRFLLGQLQQLPVAYEIGHAKIRQTGLARSEEFTG